MTTAAAAAPGSRSASLAGGPPALAHHPPEHDDTASLELLLRAVGNNKKLLDSATHLHLNGMALTGQLLSLRLCPKLQVLYCYDNQLSSISEAAASSSSRLLTHIYCQNNQLTSLNGLQQMPLLLKVYVQGNCLWRIDCLQKAHHLQELHVSDQRLLPVVAEAGREQHAQRTQQQPQDDQLVLINDGCRMQHRFTSAPPTPPTPLTAEQLLGGTPVQPGAAAAEDLSIQCCSSSDKNSNGASSSSIVPGGLWFDPLSLSAIAGTLRVLAAANCGIADPRPLAVLVRLQILDLAGNAIQTHTVLCDVRGVLGALGQLRELDLRRNPCTLRQGSSSSSSSRHREAVILAAADSLEQLDGEAVKPAHRQFLLALHSRKARAAGKASHQQQPLHVQDEEGVQHLPQQQASSSMLTEPPAAAVVAAAAGVAQQLQGLAVALKPCRAGGAKPPAVAGFKQESPQKRRAAAAAARGGQGGGGSVPLPGQL